MASVGSNPNFIASQAHCWFAFSVVTVAGHYLPLSLVVAVAITLAAVKEFVFDARYEVGQTFADNATDFAGYALGVALGYFWVA